MAKRKYIVPDTRFRLLTPEQQAEVRYGYAGWTEESLNRLWFAKNSDGFWEGCAQPIHTGEAARWAVRS